MSKPRYWWWASVRTAVRQYPRLRAKKDDLQSMQVTKGVRSIKGPDGKLHDFYAAPGSGGDGRTVERLATVELPPQEERILDAVERALEITSLAPNGETQTKILREYHFRGGLLSSIADRHFVGEATAKRWNAIFMRTVAAELGYIPVQKRPVPKKTTPAAGKAHRDEDTPAGKTRKRKAGSS